MTRQMICGAIVVTTTLSTAMALCPPNSDGVVVKDSGSVALAAMEAEPQRTVQLAICLDVSGSMDGLIDSARQQLWAVVNELATAQPMPNLTVSLLTYGNDGYNAENGWVEIQTPFTNDLDLVSKQLFALTTNGGTELVGRVLNKTNELKWDPSDDALKLVIVAGNESADQDQEMSFRDVCKKLIAQGIMVNSIYCGPDGDGLAPAWREVAQLADGRYASIDQNGPVIAIVTPFDGQLATLSAELNSTYIPFGQAGLEGCANQQAQDSNAAAENAQVMAQRAVTKSTANYRCNWDLIDACRLGQVKIDEVKTEDLPEDMQKMTEEERTAHMAKLAERREALQKEIAEINGKYQAFVSDEMAKQAIDTSKTFGSAVAKAVRAQAEAKGFTFAEVPAPASASTSDMPVAKADDC